jgi:hypothetical protein
VRCPVNIVIDFSLTPVGWHFFVPIPPVPPTPVPAFGMEMFALQMWTAGLLLGKNKFTSTVKHKSLPIVLDQHDVGPLIPDITIPFNNLYYVVMWPMSARKIVFAAYKVQMNGKPVGMTDILSLLPMLSCGNPVSNPLVFSIIAATNTVDVGYELADLVVGLVLIAFTLIGDALAYAIDPPGSSAIGMQLAGQLFPFLGASASGASLAKIAAGTVGNFVVSAIRHDQSGGVVPYSVGIQTPDNPLLGGSATYNWGSTDPSQNGVVLGGNAAGVQREKNVSTGADATGSNFGGPVNPFGFGSNVP